MALISKGKTITSKDNALQTEQLSDFSVREIFMQLSKRQRYVASYILSYEFEKTVSDDGTNFKTVVEEMASSDQDKVLDEIIRVIKNGVVEDEYFEWLVDDERSRLWFWRFFSINLAIKGNTHIPLKGMIINDYFNNIVASIDTFYEVTDHLHNPYDLHKDNKIKHKSINLYKNDKVSFMISSREVFLKKRTDDKYFKWLNKKDSEQLIWATAYLEKNGYLLSPDGFIADTNAKKIIQIKASIDAMDILNSSNVTLEMPPEKFLFIDKIRRAWSQKSFRDAGKTKTQYHLPLTKVAKARLDKMSALCNKSQAATLNDLINEAYLTKYTDEKGKDKY